MAVSLVLTAASLLAAPEPPRRVDVPAGRAAESLLQFARVTGVQLIFTDPALERLPVPAIHGTYTADEALAQLLSGTEFEAVHDVATNSYAVRRRPVVASPPAAVRAAPAGAPAAEPPAQLPPLSVEQRRTYGIATQSILPVDRAAPLYYHVVTRAEIEQSGVANLAEFLTTVPGYSGEGAESLQASADLQFANGANVNIGSFLKLRGWDARHTTVLLDGRRLPPSPESNGPDLSRIPLAAVERIEVLPFAGSALYGDGAVGGAMNILLRKDLVGPSLSVQFGDSTRGGGGEAEATWMQGWVSADGRTKLTILGDFGHRDALRLGDRDFLARVLRRLPPEQLLTSDPFGPNFQPLLRAELTGTPGVFSTTTSVLALGIPGQAEARFAVVPAGARADQLTPDAFTNTDPTALRARRQDRVVLRPPSDTGSVSVQVDHTVVPGGLEVYGELTMNRAEVRFAAPDAIEPLSLGLTDPRNPFRRNSASGVFGRSVLYYFDPIDLPDARLTQTRDGLRGVFGLRSLPASGWHWSIDSFVDRSRSHSTVGSYGASLNDLLRGWTLQNEDALAAIYNPLVDHGAMPVSAAARDRYLARNAWLDYRSWMVGAEARVGGTAGHLPAGPVRLEFGAEYEWHEHVTRQGASGSRELYTLLDSLPTYDTFTAPRQVTDRGHRLGALGEAILPLFHAGRTRLPLYAGEIDLASRVARTDGGRPAASNLAALKVAPSRSWALRATYSQGQVTPASDVVNAPVTETPATVTVVDPQRGNVTQIYPVQVVQGGSGELDRETSSARVFGLLITPPSLPGFFFSVDAWSIRMSNRLRAPTAQELVSYEGFFPGKITRNAPLGWEKALGWLGPVTRLDLRPVHVTRLEADGVDVALRYRTPATRLGVFTVSAQLETVQRYAEQFLPVSSLIDKINVVTDSSPLGLMEAAVVSPRTRATVAWARGPWSASVTSTFVPRYHTDTTDPTPAQPNATGADGPTIPSSTLWDLQLGYAVGHQARWFADTTWTLGVRNVFDRPPPSRADGTSFYSRFDDPRMRYVYARVQWRR